jgi:hypothetical protein
MDVGQLSVTVAKHLRSSTYKDEWFILVHSFESFSP